VELAAVAAGEMAPPPAPPDTLAGATTPSDRAPGVPPAAAPVPDPEPVGATDRAVGAVRRRLADVWHILVILYLIVLYGIWALEIAGGFSFVLKATLVSVATLAVARLVTMGIDRLIRRGFAIAPDMKQQFPGLEARANRYLPVLNRVLKGFVWLVAGLVVLDAWGLDSLGWLGTPFGQRVSASAVSILLILLLALVAWEVVSSLIERYLTGTDGNGRTVERSQRIRTLLPLLRNAFAVLLATLVSLIVLSELGLDIAPLLAGAGVIGLAVGFGAQTLVKDIITGLFILVEDTISVGDVVNLGGTGGLVEAVNIRTIRLRDLTGTVHTIPFSEVTRVSNLTKDFSFYVFDVGVAYREDTDKVCGVLKALGAELQADPEFGPKILEPLEMLGVDAFLDSAVVIKCRFKTRPIMQWAVGREFNRRMKRRFDELGIEIPFPHQTIYFGTDKAGNAPPMRLHLDNPDISRTLAAAANAE